MQWITDLLFKPTGVANAVLVVAIVSAIGLAIGHLRFKGISFGIAGVLFVGLIAAHFGLKINHEVLEFLRDAGLVLFVFTIGLQVGPGFFASLRKSGLPLNIAAASIVLMGAAITVTLYFSFFPRSALPAALGLMSGATTNTPSMAAAQATFASASGGEAASHTAHAPPTTAVAATAPDASALIGSAYAIAYPFGICGVLLTMGLIRTFFRIDIAEEQRRLAESSGGNHPSLEVFNVEVQNPALVGHTVKSIPTLHDRGVVITRLLRGGHVDVAKPEAILQSGDVMTAVGPVAALQDLELIVGKRTHIDARAASNGGGAKNEEIAAEAFLVSNSDAAGRTIAELALEEKFGVRVTRIRRSGIELPVTPNAKLQIGDRIMTVGVRASMDGVAAAVGNNLKVLDKPMLVPILIGIALGVLVGSMPINLGMPMPLKLGLAGGPLVVALLLGRLHRVGPLVWYMPTSANYMLRELGIVIFLACAGLKSGTSFVPTLQAHGAAWLLMGATITIIPILIVGFIARGVFKLNYLTLCGLLAGSMTDPPALSFATQITKSDAPTVAYATVYPLVMLLRVLLAQGIAIWLIAGMGS